MGTARQGTNVLVAILDIAIHESWRFLEFLILFYWLYVKTSDTTKYVKISFR